MSNNTVNTKSQPIPITNKLLDIKTLSKCMVDSGLLNLTEQFTVVSSHKVAHFWLKQTNLESGKYCKMPIQKKLFHQVQHYDSFLRLHTSSQMLAYFLF